MDMQTIQNEIELARKLASRFDRKKIKLHLAAAAAAAVGVGLISSVCQAIAIRGVVKHEVKRQIAPLQKEIDALKQQNEALQNQLQAEQADDADAEA